MPNEERIDILYVLEEESEPFYFLYFFRKKVYTHIRPKIMASFGNRFKDL